LINLQKYYQKNKNTLKVKGDKIKVGFTVGDMNGIGPEVLLKSLSDYMLLELITPVIYGPINNLVFTANHFDLDMSFNKIKNAGSSDPEKVNVINEFNVVPEISFGELDKEMGELAFSSIEKAVIDLNKNQIDVLVTAPINKEAIHSEKFNFMGHTDYIDSKVEGEAVMMMVSEGLRVALLTEHMPISKVSESITRELVDRKIKALNHTLKRDFQIERPKIAVLSIDPHGGDNGVIGSDDKKILNPAIKDLYESGILVFGPYASDSFFGSSEFKKFDLVVASFHDQGLIPFKTLSFGKGVNYTSGLSKIRTSPDHGTAFGISGKNTAMKGSFLSSIFLAIDLFKNRKTYDKLIENSLVSKKQLKSNEK
tara:strand:- start:301 stop:1404 length:1104 start_codon:yes stop_codon:yes gene_type:complete